MTKKEKKRKVQGKNILSNYYLDKRENPSCLCIQRHMFEKLCFNVIRKVIVACYL